MIFMVSVMIVAVFRLIYDFLTLEIGILSCFWRFQRLEMRFLMFKCSLLAMFLILHDCSYISLDICRFNIGNTYFIMFLAFSEPRNAFFHV